VPDGMNMDVLDLYLKTHSLPASSRETMAPMSHGTRPLDYTIYLHQHPTTINWMKVDELKYPDDYPR